MSIMLEGITKNGEVTFQKKKRMEKLENSVSFSRMFKAVENFKLHATINNFVNKNFKLL